MAGQGQRLIALDVARTVALVGMVVFHTAFDLDMLGLIAPGTTISGGWPVFARLVAGSFLVLAGISLWLSHGEGRRWPAFWRRFAKVAGAALLVTAGTWVAMPDRFVFYGILHSIAVASLVGMAVIRLPALGVLGLAAGIVAVWWGGGYPAFNGPALIWTGLAEVRPFSVDFVPPFPWLAPFLCGLAGARLAGGLWPWLAARQRGAGRFWQVLAWPGQHSLIIYLVHQPILLGGLTLWARLM